jgi:cytochrome b561
MNFRDSTSRYGLLSRVLHWGMAALLFWQYLSMIARIVLGRGPITAVMVGSHASIGTVLLILVLLRGAWGFYNWRRRPAHGASTIGRLAALGHFALYGLMFLVPLLALIRQFGSDRPYRVFGMMIWPGRAEPVEWLLQIGDTLHGELAWILSALIAGHIAMVLVHQFYWRDGTLARMS